MKKMPEKGFSKEEIIRRLEEYKKQDLDWRSGRALGVIYAAGDELRSVVDEAYMMYLVENAVDPTIYPSTLKLENEIVSIVGGDLLRGGDCVVGNLTSGGTESIMMAVLSARNRARALRPEIKEPEMIISTTAHAAFYKAAHYFCVKLVRVPVKDDSFIADVDAVRSAITRNTILLVGSAPGYAHGVIDPISEIGNLALEHSIPFHVDGCVGGIPLSILRRMGEPLPDFDFSVPGVTSISVDMHKHGYSAKNCSLILYRDRSIRRYQIFACAGWPGYSLVNPTAASTKSGGPYAAAWAALNYLGEEGYGKIVREIMRATRIVVNGIKRIPPLKVNGAPQMSMFSFSSQDPRINVFRIADEMRLRGGWFVQPQFQKGIFKSSIHVSFSSINAPRAEDFLQDLEATVEHLRTQPGAPAADLSNLVANISSMDENTLLSMLEMVGVSEDSVPERLEPINRLLESLPEETVEFILTTFINAKQRAV